MTLAELARLLIFRMRERTSRRIDRENDWDDAIRTVHVNLDNDCDDPKRNIKIREGIWEYTLTNGPNRMLRALERRSFGVPTRGLILIWPPSGEMNINVGTNCSITNDDDCEAGWILKKALHELAKAGRFKDEDEDDELSWGCYECGGADDTDYGWRDGYCRACSAIQTRTVARAAVSFVENASIRVNAPRMSLDEWREYSKKVHLATVARSMDGPLGMSMRESPYEFVPGSDESIVLAYLYEETNYRQLIADMAHCADNGATKTPWEAFCEIRLRFIAEMRRQWSEISSVISNAYPDEAERTESAWFDWDRELRRHSCRECGGVGHDQRDCPTKNAMV